MHAKYRVDKSDLDFSYLNENTSFTLAINRNPLKFRCLNKITHIILFVLWKIMLKHRRWLTSTTEINCIGLLCKTPDLWSIFMVELGPVHIGA